ncbi:MAG: tetratricopeptide repeat protein [Paraburkholderia sp.]|nr:MAG: tetratricopeptide repeat protein [Paraburkholderia sp.]
MNDEPGQATPPPHPTLALAAGDAPSRASTVRAHIDAGALIEAWEHLGAWLTECPADADACALQAQCLRLCGRYDDAQAWLDRAFAAVPAHGPAWLEAARLAIQIGAPERALDAFERAAGAMTPHPDWLSQWASLAHTMKRADIGVRVATQWCELAPDSAGAWFMLGLVQQQAGALDASRRAYESAMQLDPDLPMLRNNLSALHYDRGEYEIALRIGNEAIRAEPNHALAWTNLANVWLRLREPDKALIAARRAAALAPDFGLAQLALSNAARESQQWGEAFDAVVRAAKVAGADPKIQFSVAMLQLMQGDLRNGWINFEARWSGSPELASSVAFCPERRWHGQSLTGKTLLVWGEQGHGDAIQFIRFLPQLAERARAAGGKIVCCCFPPLYALFKRSLAACDVDVLPSDIAQLPAFDYQIPLASLPLALDVTLESLPAPAAYLSPDAGRVEWWRAAMRQSTSLKVGLVWSGSHTHQRNALRAVAPERYAQAFAGVAGVDWYSLQMGAAQDVARMAQAGLQLIDRTSELNDFDDTAALIGSLDLVITVCTSVAHLAAALGRPTWVLLDGNPHWVWMTERRDSPWYPTVRLYRQRNYRDWTQPLADVRADLVQAIEQAANASAG